MCCRGRADLRDLPDAGCLATSKIPDVATDQSKIDSDLMQMLRREIAELD